MALNVGGTKKEREYLGIKDVKILRAVNNDWGVFFSMVLNGITINDCKLAQAKDGKIFISFPSKKGKDGSYFNIVYAAISDEDTQEIVKLIAAFIEAKN